MRDEVRHLQSLIANVQSERKRLKEEDVRAKVEKEEARANSGSFGSGPMRDGP